MTGNASIIRSGNQIEKAVEEAHSILNNFHDIGASTVKELAGCFRIYDNCLAHAAYLEAIKAYIENGGRSRGSFLVVDTVNFTITDISAPGADISMCAYDRDVERDILEVRFVNGRFIHNLVKVRKIPDQDLWFEKVWKDYLEDNFMES
jgi:hypothetical protein